MPRQDGKPDWLLAELASRAHGVVARGELLHAGFTEGQVRQRLKRGTLIAIHRGIYRVGHNAPSIEATYLAAVKACGGSAALCGPASAHSWLLTRGAPPVPEVLATVKRHVRGVITHRTRSIDPRDVTERNGIPLTTVARTIVDVAAVFAEPLLARACHEAEVRYRVGPDDVEAVLARRPSSAGARTLRRILHGYIPVTLSKLESRFLERLKGAGLPLPEMNRIAGGRRVDCRWPKQALTVELDGFRYHRTRQSWERDRLREREARARGDEFRRFTYGDVLEDPRYMLAELKALLSRQGLPTYG